MPVANRLGIETQDSERRRILLEAVADVSAPKAATAEAAPPKPEPPKETLGEKVGNVLGAAATATGGGLKKGGKHIADALVPPPASQEGGLSRAGEGAYGLLEAIMAATGVHGGAAGLKAIVEQVGDPNADAGLPVGLNYAARIAQGIFSLPALLDPAVRAEAGGAGAAVTKMFADAENMRPFTRGELAEFAGAFAGPLAVGKAAKGKSAKPPTAKDVKAAADKAVFDQGLAAAAAKDTKAAEARAARQQANQEAFEATKETPPAAVPEVDAVLGVESAPTIVDSGTFNGQNRGALLKGNEQMIVARNAAGQDMGFMHLSPEEGGYTVRKIEVLPEFQRQGVATMLDAEAQARYGEYRGATDQTSEGAAFRASRGVDRRSAEPGNYTGLERRAGIVPPAEALGVEPVGAVAKTEGMKGAAAEAQINKELGVPPSEIVVKPKAEELQPIRPEPLVEAPVAAPLPEIQTLADAHEIARSVTADAMPQVAESGRTAQAFMKELDQAFPPNEASVKATKEASASLAKEMRASGMSEADIRDAVRAKLNEGGLLSKKQILEGSEVARFLEKTAAKADAQDLAIQAEMLTIKTRLDEIAAQLGPGVEPLSADMASTLAQRVSASLMDPASLENQPGAAVKALTDVGVKKARAEGIVNGIIDAYKASGLSDETGHMFFWGKDANKTQPVYDVVAAEAKLGERAKLLGVRDALRVNSKDRPKDLPATLAAVADARDASTAQLNSILRRWKEGAKIAPDDLFDSAVFAGAAADKARTVEGRWGPDSQPGRLHGGHRPVKEAELARFSDRLHRDMTEPELYAKLQTLDPRQQQQFLANYYRSSAIPGIGGGYMSFYVAAKLSGPWTLARATLGDLSMIPMDLAATQMGAMIGKIMPGTEHIMMGDASIKAKAYWQTMTDQVSLLAKRDWDGIKTQMVIEGEFNPPIAHPTNLFYNIVNATAGAASYTLGAERASSKIINRIGQLDLEAHLQARREHPQSTKEFAQAVEHYRRNPTAEMMKAADAHAEFQTFTAELPGIGGMLQKTGSSNLVKVLVSPFPRLDVGMLDMALQGTPILNLLSDRWRADFAAGGRARDLAMGRTATGSLVLGTGMVLAMQGMVTGPGPSDPAQRKVLELAGWRPNYIYNPATGQPLFSHSSLGAISSWLGTAAEAAHVLRHAPGQAGQQLVSGILHTMAAPFENAGYLEAWGEVVDTIKNGATTEKWLRYMRNKVADIALAKPALVTFATQQTQPEGKPDLAKPRGGLLERELGLLFDEVTSGWPGYSKGFPTVKNFLTYEAIPRDGMLPWNREVTKDPVAKEIYRLGNKLGDPSTIYAPPDHVGGSKPAEGLAVDKPTQGVRLEAWEKDRMLQIMATEIRVGGRTLHAAMQAEIDSSKYELAATDELRSLRLYKLYSAFKVGAQGKLLQEDKHLRWLVEKQKQEYAGSMGSIRYLGPEPPPTKYPRPSQIR